MRSLKYILLFAVAFSLYAYFSDLSTKKDENEKLRTAFETNLNNCNYSPFDKLQPPYFQGSIGFVIPNNLDNEKDFDVPWKIKTYLQTGPEYYIESRFKIQERIKVKVIKEHIIKNSRYNSYLTVQCIDTLKDISFIIRGNSFSEIPYWNCDLEDAIRQGPILAKLKEGAELPTFEGEWINLSKKSIIICTNVTGFHKELIEAYVFDITTKKHYYRSVSFKKESLIALQY